MLAWSLTGPILLTLAAPAVGDRAKPSVKAVPPLRIVSIARPAAYQLPSVVLANAPDHIDAPRNRRLDRALMATRATIADPGGDSVRSQLRDRLLRRGGAVDGRVEWRLTRQNSDLGLGGGLARVVDAVLQR